MVWKGWVSLVLGLWLAVAPFVGHADALVRYSGLVGGLVVAALAVAGLAGGKHEAHKEQHAA